MSIPYFTFFVSSLSLILVSVARCFFFSFFSFLLFFFLLLRCLFVSSCPLFLDLFTPGYISLIISILTSSLYPSFQKNIGHRKRKTLEIRPTSSCCYSSLTFLSLFPSLLYLFHISIMPRFKASVCLCVIYAYKIAFAVISTALSAKLWGEGEGDR